VLYAYRWISSSEKADNRRIVVFCQSSRPPKASECHSAEATSTRWISVFVKKMSMQEQAVYTKLSPQCSTGSWLVHICTKRAHLCQPKTWWSSIWCVHQTDRLSLTSGTYTTEQHCRHSHQPGLTTLGIFRSEQCPSRSNLTHYRKVLPWMYVPCQKLETLLWNGCKQTQQSVHWYLALVQQTGCMGTPVFQILTSAENRIDKWKLKIAEGQKLRLLAGTNFSQTKVWCKFVLRNNWYGVTWKNNSSGIH